MGQASDPLKPGSTDEAQQRIRRLRDEMSAAVDELSRRRHDMLDWRLQLQRHRRLVAIIAGSLALTGLVIGVVSYRRRHRPMGRFEHLADSLRRWAVHEERRRRTKDVAATGFKSMASTAGRSLGQRLGTRLIS